MCGRVGFHFCAFPAGVHWNGASMIIQPLFIQICIVEETTHMNWLSIGLIGAIVFTLHSLQQIKMTLKDKGYQVEMMTGWLEDYRRFKQMTLSEPDETTRYKYQRILNGLYLALAGLVFIPLLMIMGK